MTGRCRIRLGNIPVEIEFELDDITPSYLGEFVEILYRRWSKREAENDKKTVDTDVEADINEEEIERFIRSKPSYEFSVTEILEKFFGIKYKRFKDIYNNKTHAKVLYDVYTVCKKIRKKISEEENGTWIKKQKWIDGKNRNVYVFNSK